MMSTQRMATHPGRRRTGRRSGRLVMRTLAMLSVVALTALLGSCLSALPCGGGYCAAGYSCVQADDEPKCRACNHCGDQSVTPEAGEVCDRASLVATSCVDLRYDFGRPGCSESCDNFLTASYDD
jgi:hypothetical protein